MVRLLGKLAEKRILPTHDTILKHGTKLLGTGNASVDSGTTTEILTGFNSVKKAWFQIRMKTGPGANATLNVRTPMLRQSDDPTAGSGMVVVYSSVGTGYVTVDWFAIGD